MAKGMYILLVKFINTKPVQNAEVQVYVKLAAFQEENHQAVEVQSD